MTFANLPIGATFKCSLYAGYSGIYVKTRQERVNTCRECGHKIFVSNAKTVDTSSPCSFSGDTPVEELGVPIPIEVTA